MTGDWIKMRKSLRTDPRVVGVSRKCHALSVTVVGALHALWSLADDHATDDGMLPNYTPDTLDAEVGVEGFTAALPADWCEVRPDGVYLPNYQAHNGPTGKQRAQAARRQARTRRHARVTPASRPERDKSATRAEERRGDNSMHAARARAGERNGTPIGEVEALLVVAGVDQPIAGKLAERSGVTVELAEAAVDLAEERRVGNRPGLIVTMLRDPPADLMERVEGIRRKAAEAERGKLAAEALECDRRTVAAIPVDQWSGVVERVCQRIRQQHPHAHPEHEFRAVGQSADRLPPDLISAAAEVWNGDGKVGGKRKRARGPVKEGVGA